MSSLINLAPLLRTHFEERIVKEIQEEFKSKLTNIEDNAIVGMVASIFTRTDGMILGLKLPKCGRIVVESKVQAPIVSFLSFFCDRTAEQQITVSVDKGVFETVGKLWTEADLTTVNVFHLADGVTLSTPDNAFKAVQISYHDLANINLKEFVASLNEKFKTAPKI